MDATWKIVFYVMVALAVPPFVLMYAAWIALRLKKLRLPRWRRFQRVWFFLGLGLLAAGAGLHLLGPEDGHPAAFVALLGGMTNTIVAAFQGRIVDVLSRPPTR